VSIWRLTPQAEADLEDIFAYTVEQWDFEQAERYHTGLLAMFDALVVDVWRGTVVSPRHGELLKQRSGRHLIIFLRTEIAVEIVRVLHERMDADTQLN
jgi:toxin ParE1/3/4